MRIMLQESDYMGVVFHFYNSDDDDDDEDDARSPSKSTRKTVKQLEVYVCLFVVVHLLTKHLHERKW